MPKLGPGIEPAAQVHALHEELHPQSFCAWAETLTIELTTEHTDPGILDHISNSCL